MPDPSPQPQPEADSGKPDADRSIPELSEEMRRTLEFISAPENAHLFTAEAARRAFAHVKV